MPVRFSRRTLFKLGSGLAAAPTIFRSGSGAQAAGPDAALDAIGHLLTSNGWGTVVRPGDPKYATIKYHNGRFDCVVTTTYLRPTTVEGVVQLVTWAAANHRSFAIRGAGHSFAGKSSHPDLVIDMSQMRGLSLAPDGTLHVQAGVQLGAVYTLLTAAGRIVAAGTCPTVGIVGHALGGGIGDFLPMFGYAAQSILTVTMVTLAGTILKISDGGVEVLGGAPMPGPDIAAPDLMRVLRGGGQGSLGIVTDMTFRTYDLSSYRLASFRLAGVDRLSPTEAGAIIGTWQDWRINQPAAMQAMVSSKINLSFSKTGFDMEIEGLFAMPSGEADPMRSLSALLGAARWPVRDVRRDLDAKGAVASFLDTDETTNNPQRLPGFAASSILPGPLPARALAALMVGMPVGVDVSFYTSGGTSKLEPQTALHPSEFLIEWITPKPGVYRQIRALNALVMDKAGFKNLALPSYPDPEPRDYFQDAPGLQALRSRFDPGDISTSSLLGGKAGVDYPKCWKAGR